MVLLTKAKIVKNNQRPVLTQGNHVSISPLFLGTIDVMMLSETKSFFNVVKKWADHLKECWNSGLVRNPLR
jgi:hypothetical protein